MAKVTAKRARVDWEAVIRDYRTGSFTDGELSTKHSVSREAIVRRRKREPHLWPQDLTKAVREATNAALATAMVTEAITAGVTEGHSRSVDTVLAAAEVNKQIILGHCKDAKAARAAMDGALAKVMECGKNVKDIRDAAAFASAVESLSRTAKNAAEMERKALRLDEDKPPLTGATEVVVRYQMPEHAPEH